MGTERKKLDGKITISRPQCSNGSQCISISIEDATSSCHILVAEISLEEFAAAVTGLGYRPCKLEYFSQEPIGKKREVKTEFVPGEITFTKNKTKELKQKAKLLKPFEVDGWEGYLEDLGNMHHRHILNGVTGFNVSFIRFVEQKEK